MLRHAPALRPNGLSEGDDVAENLVFHPRPAGLDLESQTLPLKVWIRGKSQLERLQV